MPTEDRPLRLLISFSPKDQELKEQLVVHLQVLVRDARIDLWTVDRVPPGDSWRQEVDAALCRADVALLLISADFLASDFLQDVEVPKLFQRREHGGLKLIPVLLRDCLWEEHLWLGALKPLPTSKKAVASLQGNDRDLALKEVAKEIAQRAGTGARVARPMESWESRVKADKVAAESLAPAQSARPPRSGPDAAVITSGRNTPHVGDVVANASLYTVEQKYMYRDDLKNRILSRRKIPTRHLYCTPEGCKLWLDLCKRPQYSSYRDSVEQLTNEIEKVVSAACGTSGETEFDLISLGCGDGNKDKIILKELSKRARDGECTWYYPLDISDSMIIEALRTIATSGLGSGQTRVHAVVADMVALAALKGVWGHRPNKKIFSILGNTLGNSSEAEIMDAIRDAMDPGDFLLLEVNTKQADNAAYLSMLRGSGETAYLPMASTLVVSLGLTFDAKRMKYVDAPSMSVVPDTRTVAAYYDELILDDNQCADVRLSVIHYYDLKRFITAIEEKLLLRVLFKEEYRGIALLLAQRAAK